jgi:hypothetical protein
LSPRHRHLLQLVFDQFQRDAAWPQVARLQHMLARQGDGFNVRTAALGVDRSLAIADVHTPSGELRLTIKGVRRCTGADQLLGNFARAVNYFVRRYLEAVEPPAEVTSAELERDLELSAVEGRKVRLLLESSHVPTAGGGGTEDNWQWRIDDQILRYRGATTIDQIIRRTYPPGWPGGPVRLPADSGRLVGLVDWAASAPGWGNVDERLRGLHEKLRAATTPDDWQDVGRRCREIMIEAANVVFTPRLVPPGSQVPGTNDAKARLDAYFATRMPNFDDDMRAFVTGAWRLANALTHHPSMGVGDPAELLDVDMEQLARALADIADRDTRGAVAIAQAGQAVAAEDVADRRARTAGDRRQAVRPEAELVTGRQDRRHLLLGQTARRTVGSRAPILEAGQSLGLIAPDPLGGRLPAHPGHRGRMGDRPALQLDPFHEQPPAKHRQLRPTMHLRALPWFWSQTPQIPRTGLSPVNNVLMNHI